MPHCSFCQNYSQTCLNRQKLETLQIKESQYSKWRFISGSDEGKNENNLIANTHFVLSLSLIADSIF